MDYSFLVFCRKNNKKIPESHIIIENNWKPDKNHLVTGTGT
jgi:hypothetical protein